MTSSLNDSASPRNATRVALKGVCIAYGDFNAVDHVDLDIEPGEIMALVGPSGCGKTSLLKSVAGLQPLAGGHIEFDGSRIDAEAAHKRQVGMVFQNYALFPHMSVKDNVAFGLKMSGIKADGNTGGNTDGKAERVADALAMLQISHLADSWPDELSGGQQQRVALARTLVCEPRVLLLDEPLSALDRQLRDTMRAEIRRLVKAVGITTILVTHDQDEAMSMADRVAVMRSGLIEQLGTPRELYESPTSEFVASFIGRSARLKGHLVSVNGSVAKIVIAGGVLLGQLTPGAVPPPLGCQMSLLIRPDGIGLSDGIAQVSASVEDLLFMGERIELRLRLRDGQTIKIEMPAHKEMPPQGSDVGLVVATEKAFAFPSSSA